MEPTGLLAAQSQRLTPEQVRDWELPVVMRGYERHTVTHMQEAVIGEMQALITERDEYARECERLSRAMHVPAHGTADPGEQAARILMAAQQQREQLLQQTQAYAKRVGEDGERRRRDLLADGRSRGEAMAETLIREASQKAADIVAQAPGDAQERLVRVRATGDALEAHLSAVLGGLTSALDRWRTERAELIPEHVAGNGSHA
jgi:cell division septum initiation protein DivIVA